jgi:hypothetical protein
MGTAWAFLEATMFRISKDTRTIIDVAKVHEIAPAVRALKPGRYQIDQLERDPIPSGHTS